MVEIFTDIPERVKAQTKFWVDMALMQKSPIDAIQMVKEYRDSCFTEEEQDFVDFYFNLRLEQLLNASTSN